MGKYISKDKVEDLLLILVTNTKHIKIFYIKGEVITSSKHCFVIFPFFCYKVYILWYLANFEK
jgi:hypothetical protein